jgi:outer membrane protein
LKSEITNYNTNRNKMIEDFNKLKVDNTNNLLRLINPILIDFSNDKEISIILQKKDLVVAKTELDITDEIIKIINTEVKEFKIK